MDPQGGDDPYQRFFTKLNDLRAWAGQPSTRDLAKQTSAAGYACSHTTVAKAFKPGRSLPRWRVVQTLVRIMNGDEMEFRQLWFEASGGSPAPVVHTDASPVHPVSEAEPESRDSAPQAGPAPAASRDVSLWSWRLDYDPATAPQVIHVLAAAIKAGTDVSKLLMGLALDDPHGTAPVLNLAINNNLKAAAEMVAGVAHQDPSKAEILLREAIRVQRSRVIDLLRLLIDLHDIDQLLLLAPAMYGAVQEPQHGPFVRDLVVRLARAGQFDQVRDRFVEMAVNGSGDDFSAVALMLEQMLHEPDDRGGGIQLLAFIAKANMDIASALFVNIITDREEPARWTGPDGRTLLGVLQEAWPRGTGVLMLRAVINYPSRRAQLGTVIHTLCRESFDLATDLVVLMAFRATTETAELLLSLSDLDVVARIMLAVHRHRPARERAGRLLAAWIRARHPTVSAPAGFLIKQLCEIDARGTVALLVTTLSVAPSVRFHDAVAGLLDAQDRRELRNVLYSHATPDQREAIRALF